MHPKPPAPFVEDPKQSTRGWLEAELAARLGMSAEHIRRANLPRSVMACELGTRHLELVNKATGEVILAPWKCKSWRHAGECRTLNMNEKRERIEKALAGYDFQDVVFMVLTIDPRAKRGSADLGDPYLAFKELAKLWRCYAQYLRREWGFAGFVSTVEAHASGMPHLNVLMVSRALAADLRRPDRWRVLEELKGAARRCHFGPMLTAEAARKPMNVARYIAKLAVEVDDRVNRGRLVREVEKNTQTPVTAPERFRTMRSSKKFLPPVVKGEVFTGRLIRRPLPRPRLVARASLANAFQMELLWWAARRPLVQLALPLAA